VKGWSGQRQWINTASWLARVNAAGPLARACKPDRRGADAVGTDGYVLLGRSVPAPERKQLAESGLGATQLLRALLSLPEAHLA